MTETKEKPADTSKDRAVGADPPVNPFFVHEDVFALHEGEVRLIYPPRMSLEDYTDLKQWLELEVHKIGRWVEEDAIVGTASHPEAAS